MIKQVLLSLPEKLHEDVKLCAKIKPITMHNFMVAAIEEKVKKELKKGK
ncbi:MAG: hypothetical protein ACFFG0_03700 [Candidatus Thorarchaeota archaeon]